MSHLNQSTFCFINDERVGVAEIHRSINIIFVSILHATKEKEKLRHTCVFLFLWRIFAALFRGNLLNHLVLVHFSIQGLV